MSDDGAGGRHRLINPDSLAPPVGFSHAVSAAPGRTVYLAGQAGHRKDLSLPDSLVDQFDQACANVVEAVHAAGGRPEHVVSIQIFVIDASAYRAALGEIGRTYRRHFGRHYPAMTLVEVSGLFDASARVELTAVAVVPE